LLAAWCRRSARLFAAQSVTLRRQALDQEAVAESIGTYEWLPGEFFLLNRTDPVMAATVVRSIETLGPFAVEEKLRTADYGDSPLPRQQALSGVMLHVTGVTASIQRGH
jgi:hypothetical protein